MKLMLPPGLSSGQFDAALKDFGAAIGDEWVLHTDLDRDTYLDHFAVDEAAHAPSAALAPLTTAEVQEILRIANKHKVPLWPISRGKNFGYGGSAPRLKGSVVLDLSRMRKIEFDEANGVALVEPGVGFYDLYDYIQQHKLPFWTSVPGNSWGSVLGNALDRGVGYTTYGEHTAKLCGLEVVMPDGEIAAHRHGRHDGLADVEPLQVRIRSLLGPDVRAVQLRRGHQGRRVVDAGPGIDDRPEPGAGQAGRPGDGPWM